MSKNIDRKYIHLFPYMIDHNQNTCGHGIVTTHDTSSQSSVFPGREIRLVLSRKFRPVKNYPRTITINCRCSKEHHKITYGLDGSIKLHAHDNIEELRSMSLFMGEKPRCLEVYDAWMGCTDPKKASNNWGDSTLSEIRNVIPTKARQTLNWIYLQSNRIDDRDDAVYSRQINRSRHRFNRERENARKTFDVKVQEFRKSITDAYFQDLAPLFYESNNLRRYVQRIPAGLSWFETVRKHKLDKLELFNSSGHRGMIFHAGINGREGFAVIYFKTVDERGRYIGHETKMATLLKPWNTNQWKVSSWL